MICKIFLDSDIFLDILLFREPHFESSVSIFHLRIEQEVELFTSPSIILNINYIAQKQYNKEKALKGVSEILKIVEIVETTGEILINCFNHKYVDVEDAVQYFTASQNNSIKYFITRNVRHFRFKNTDLKILTPTDFLKLFKQKP
ncbi:MAG: PIN domain-containing protein [Ginsengibacter sp.]